MPPDRRSTDAQVAELRQATENLSQQVANLQGTIATVNQLQSGQQQIQQTQQEIQRKVVFKDAFDEAWRQNASRLQQYGRTNRKMALASLLASLAIVGCVGGWLVTRQANVNHDQDHLTAQRVAACETKNHVAQVGAGYLDGLITREKARPHPDSVLVDFLSGVREYELRSIVPCPGATPSPTASQH